MEITGYKQAMKHIEPRAKGGRVGKLNAAKRKKIPTSKFGLPKERKYPMPDRSHAINAKARATQMAKRGKLSASSEEKIKAKADRIIRKRLKSY